MSDARSLDEQRRRELAEQTLAEASNPPPSTHADEAFYNTPGGANDATLPAGTVLPNQPVSKEQFVLALSVSGLMTTDELHSLDDSLSPHERPADANSLIELLLRKKRLTEYQATQLRLGQTKGLVFGNYVVVDKLGEGGMGIVFKAQHRRMKRTVALKILPCALTNSPDAIARFHREVEAAAKLTHPNIAAAYDADEAAGVHFLVMEYVDGKNLSQMVKQSGPCTIGTALNCILQAARGLNHAHLRGVVHRDIKPGNLLIDQSGTVKILDMGLARFETGSGEEEQQQAELTQSGRVMGTVDYMAPEQALDAKHADQRADIYSLGCTLWYLLTARPISPEGTLTQKLIWHQTNATPVLSQTCPAVGPRLDAVFQKMLAKKPAERHQTMAELIGDLETCLSELSPEDAAAAIAGFSCGVAGDPTLNQARTGHATLVERPTVTQFPTPSAVAPLPLTAPPAKSKLPWIVAALLVIVGGGSLAAFLLNNGKPTPADPQIHLSISHPGAQLILNNEPIAFNQFKTDADEQHRCVPAKVGQKYAIKVAKPGFEDFVQTVDVKSPEHVTLNVVLKPIPAADPGVKPNPPPEKNSAEKFLRWVFVQRGAATLSVGSAGQTVEVQRATDIPNTPFIVKAVKLDDAKLTDADFAMLGDAPTIESLSLKAAPLSAAAADHLTKLTSLWSLDLSGGSLAPGAAAKLGAVKTLRDLNLHKTNVTDADLVALDGLSKLENLYLTDTGVTDAAFKSISAHAELRTLALNGTKVTANGVEGLKDALPKIKITWDPPDIDREIARKLLAAGAALTLTLDGANNAIAVAKAADLPEPRFHIKGASFANVPAIDDSALADVRQLTQLQTLNLEGTSITAVGLDRLSTVASLKTIDLGSLQVADGAVEALKAALPNAEIRWNPNNERQTAEWVIQQKGVVSVISPDGEQVNKINDAAKLPAGRFQLREARLDGTAVTDADLKRFKGLTRLEVLGLMNTAVTNAGIVEIVSCTGLRDLWLSDTKVTEAALPTLNKFASLRSLLLAGLPITDRGLEQLKLTQLTHLSLAKTPITDDALTQLSGLQALTWLALSGTNLTDAGLPALKRLTTLSELYVDGTKLTDAGLEELGATLPKCKLLGNPLDRQRLAARAFLTLGGVVATEAGEIRRLTELPRTACRLTKVDLGDLGKVTNEHLAALSACPTISDLDLTGAQINDEALKNLASLTNLQRLSLANTRITDTGLAQLKTCRQLQSLSLAGTRVTGDGLAQLAECTELTTLVLDTAKLNDRGAGNLAPFAKLTTLNLNGNNSLTDKVFTALAGLPELKVVSLQGTQVSDTGLPQLAKLAAITHLDLGNTLVTDAGVGQLKSLANLKSLSLYGNTGVGDGSLTALAGVKTLRALDVARTKVTDGGVASLKQALPECRVIKSENRADPNNPPLDDGGAGGGFRPFGRNLNP